jgi:hypothetical protein
VLPAFQVRVPIWTGDSDSNPERAHGDKFLAVNDLTGKTAGGVKGSKGIQKLEPEKNTHQLSSWLEFYSSVFLGEIRGFCHLEDIIHSVGVPVSDL